jgi:hypothetical protein
MAKKVRWHTVGEWIANCTPWTRLQARTLFEQGRLQVGADILQVQQSNGEDMLRDVFRDPSIVPTLYLDGCLVPGVARGPVAYMLYKPYAVEVNYYQK